MFILIVNLIGLHMFLLFVKTFPITYFGSSIPIAGVYHLLIMLVDSLVLSCMDYALPVWGTALSQHSIQHLLQHLQNWTIRFTMSLCKYDHVSQHHLAPGWLTTAFIQNSLSFSLCHLTEVCTVFYTEALSL